MRDQNSISGSLRKRRETTASLALAALLLLVLGCLLVTGQQGLRSWSAAGTYELSVPGVTGEISPGSVTGERREDITTAGCSPTLGPDGKTRRLPRGSRISVSVGQPSLVSEFSVPSRSASRLLRSSRESLSLAAPLFLLHSNLRA